ncbi:hypothetical protein SAMN04488689_102505 [Paenibacillus sp. cl6col]|nr:hypothetical protein SAMN04488689_102505 [Paenibacillus sp. cl6col]
MENPLCTNYNEIVSNKNRSSILEERFLFAFCYRFRRNILPEPERVFGGFDFFTFGGL